MPEGGRLSRQGMYDIVRKHADKAGIPHGNWCLPMSFGTRRRRTWLREEPT